MNRLTTEQAKLVRIDAASGIGDEVLAVRYGASERAIRDCRLGLRYKTAGGPVTNRKRRLTDEEIRAMREEATDTDVSLKSLAGKFGVSVSYVSYVICGKRRGGAGGPISGPRYYLRS